MKKLLALLVIVVMAATTLTGCTDPVYDDFENFMNVEMTEITADYTKFAEAFGELNLEDDAALAETIKADLLPIIDGSIEKLADVKPATDEVKELKAKYVKVMETYKKALETLHEACETQDDETVNTAVELINKAVELLDEYNKAVETMAADYGVEVEY